MEGGYGLSRFCMGEGVRRHGRGKGLRRLGFGKGMKTWQGRVLVEEILHGGGVERTWARNRGGKTGFGKRNEDMVREVMS